MNGRACRGVYLGMTPGFLKILFHKTGIKWFGGIYGYYCTAGSFGDYDFGGIAGSMHMARVFCCKSYFMQRKTYLAMFR